MLDFCIIGTPKAGTTSLFNWLDAHPELQGARPKETHFLMDSDHPLSGLHGVTYAKQGACAYKQFFSSNDSSRQRFEATTQYFYQQTARDYLSSLKPQPNVLILLREPADRILSSFRFTRDNLGYCDRALTFDTYVHYLLSDNTTKLDAYFHSEGSLYIAKRELQLSYYRQWLDWWLQSLDSERLEIILFDELKNNPTAVVNHLCSRLNIDSDFYRDFDFGQHNATYPVGKRTIHRIARPLGSLVPGGELKERLKNKYLAWQKAAAEPDRHYERGLRNLRDYFASANNELATQYGLDLSAWQK